jgi:nitrate reductase NapE component
MAVVVRSTATIILASLAVASGANNTAATVSFKNQKDSCELVNGFKYEECGTMNNVKVCCDQEEQCVNAKPWEGDEQFVCSKNRKLSGNKVVKIVLLPIVLSITFLGAAGYLFRKFQVIQKKDLTTGLCIKQIILSVFLLYSPVWALGLYTVILNFLVASGVNTKGLAWWTYRLLFILQMFHIIAIFGPFETFHVPFGSLATYKDSYASNNLEAFVGSQTEAGCSAYYGNYFNLENIELLRQNADPNQKTFGYCFQEWITTVQFFVIVVGVLQCVITFRTGQTLLDSQPSSSLKKDEASV